MRGESFTALALCEQETCAFGALAVLPGASVDSTMASLLTALGPNPLDDLLGDDNEQNPAKPKVCSL